jgi:hypothetical protein
MAGRVNWTKEQDERTVAAYFALWSRIRAGERVNKTETYRRLGSEIGRAHKAVEWKFQNISAVLQEFGSGVWAPGLKPGKNFQELLADSVLEWLNTHPGWLDELAGTAETVAELPTALDDEEAPPDREAPLTVAMGKLTAGRSPRVLDFLEINQRNRALGLRGEEFIVERERRWLHDVARAPGLAKRVEWVSQTQGDGLGFDIASFGPDGAPRLIEVKTTTFGKCTPFFITRNEVATSRREARVYQLYRVFSFANRPRFYRLAGPLDESCELDPQTFVGRAASTEQQRR